jgi:hypothetical protein
MKPVSKCQLTIQMPVEQMVKMGPRPHLQPFATPSIVMTVCSRSCTQFAPSSHPLFAGLSRAIRLIPGFPIQFPPWCSLSLFHLARLVFALPGWHSHWLLFYSLRDRPIHQDDYLNRCRRRMRWVSWIEGLQCNNVEPHDQFL